jgi:cytidine deaminase
MNELKITYQLLDDWTQLSAADVYLVERAYSISEDAYAPYSNFKVGAAVLLDNDEVVVGSNQENIAFPSGLCAERVALFHVGSNYPNRKVVKIAIVAKGDLVPMEKILSPCGACRQVMLETETRQNAVFEVILVSQNGKALIFNAASDLLPFAF